MIFWTTRSKRSRKKVEDEEVVDDFDQEDMDEMVKREK
jgi:hypothetical protein